MDGGREVLDDDDDDDVGRVTSRSVGESGCGREGICERVGEKKHQSAGEAKSSMLKGPSPAAVLALLKLPLALRSRRLQPPLNRYP